MWLADVFIYFLLPKVRCHVELWSPVRGGKGWQTGGAGKVSRGSARSWCVSKRPALQIPADGSQVQQSWCPPVVPHSRGTRNHLSCVGRNPRGASEGLKNTPSPCFHVNMSTWAANIWTLVWVYLWRHSHRKGQHYWMFTCLHQSSTFHFWHVRTLCTRRGSWLYGVCQTHRHWGRLP